MAELTYTKNQRDAVEAAHGNLLVSAAAGSGKTAVLAGRVIRLLTGNNPISADRLIIVTYTVAAAAQLRKRIEDRLAALLEQDPDNPLLQSQQLLLPSARISTIHALCSEMVRDHTPALGVPPDMRVGETGEIADLKREVMEAVLEECYQQEDADFVRMMDHLCGRDDTVVLQMAHQVYEFVRAYPFPMAYLDRFLQMYQTEQPFLHTVWGAEVHQHVTWILESMLNRLHWMLECIQCDKQLADKYLTPIQNDREAVESIRRALAQKDWDTAHHVLQGYEKKRLGSVLKYHDQELQQKIKDTRTDITKQLQKLKDGVLASSEQDIQADMQQAYAQMKPLFEMVRAYDQRIWEQKKKRSILEFADLEHLTLQLLVDQRQDGAEQVFEKTMLAQSLSAQVDEIMIDECQDINTIQNLIFWAMSTTEASSCQGMDALLTQGKNLFLVGDVKQSIYRFRNAMPSLFIRRSQLFPPYTPEIGAGEAAKIVLQQNFRSRKQVTDSVNQIFAQLMNQQIGEICYDEQEQLIPSADYLQVPHCETELHLLESVEQGDKSVAEADYVASLIQRMVSAGHPVQQDDQLRACSYRDFCILLRAKKGKTNIYAQALKRRDIPFHAAQAEGYFDSFEVSVMLSLLRVIDNPLLDIPLFSVLLSPMFLFTPDQLVKLRLKDRTAPLYTVVMLAANDGDQGCKNFLSMLSLLREQAVVLPIERLIRLIYDQTGFLYVVGSMELGRQKQTNLRLLLSCAESYEQTGMRGLDGFIRYLDKLMAQQQQLSFANAAAPHVDAVQIMTIHASKGLEFPICIVADLNKGFYSQDLTKSLLLHQTYGFGMEIRKPQTLQKYTTPNKEALRLVLNREMLSEEMRILYVAMTRAKEKLILTGGGKNLQKLLTKVGQAVAFDQHIAPLTLMRMSSFLEWIVAALYAESDMLASLSGERQEVLVGTIRCIFDQAAGQLERPAPELTFCAQPDPYMRQKLEEVERFQYPYQTQTQLPAKLSVTDLTKAEHEHLTSELLHWDTQQPTTLSAAQRGTILHRFLQCADFKGIQSDLAGEINRLVTGAFLTEQEAATLNRSKIKAFADSALFERMIRADACYREYAFFHQISAREVSLAEEESLTGEKIIVQGIADVVLLERHELVIIDYKTDSLHHPEQFVRRYEKQLAVYKQALSAYFERPVKQCLIYSLHLEQEIPV